MIHKQPHPIAPNHSYSLPFVAKASKIIYIWPCFAIGFICIAIGANSQNWTQLARLSIDHWLFLLSILSGFGIITWACSLHRIVLTSDRIVFDEVFSKAEIFYSNIEQVDVSINSSSGGKAPHIAITRNANQTIDRFSLALCSAKDCSMILKIITQCAPHITLSSNARRVMKGDFPPIF